MAVPITAVRNTDGEWLRVTVNLPGGRLSLRAWQAQIGRVTLYLLDSSVERKDDPQTVVSRR